MGTHQANILAEVIDKLPHKFLASLGDMWAMRSALLCELQLALIVLAVATLSWFVKGCAGSGLVLLTYGKSRMCCHPFANDVQFYFVLPGRRPKDLTRRF